MDSGKANSLLSNGLIALVLILSLYRFVPLSRPIEGTLQPVVESPRIGTTLAIKNHLDARRGAIVLATASTCEISLASVDLYKALLQSTLDSRHAWNFVIIGDQTDEGFLGWVAAHGLLSAKVIQLRKADLGFWATPTLMLVDREGTVTDLAIGRLNPQQERTLWERLDGVDSAPPLESYIAPLADESYIERLRPQLLDVRDRRAFGTHHRLGALNIPDNEVSLTAPLKLQKSVPVVVDCSSYILANCYLGALTLHSAGFDGVRVFPPVPASRSRLATWWASLSGR
jgi:rhodanese-related sulfurtransferase